MSASLTKYLQWFFVATGVLLVGWAVIDPQTRAQFLTGSGLSQGALIAAIALGVVLTYRGSGVVNFANGAVAMYIAYVYAVLRREGDLFLPPLPNPLAPIEGVVHWFQADDTFDLPDIPTRISFGPNMQFWPALGIALVFSLFLGWVMHVLIFRPLRAAPPLAKVVASIGLFLYLQAVILRRFGITPYGVRQMPFFEQGSQVNLGAGVKMTTDQFTIVVLIVVFTVVLWLLFQRTRFGLATRAAAENEKGAVLLGFSPDFLAGANWMLSSLITGLLGIFAATVQATVDPGTIPALIIPALTAALVGGFTSFGWTTFASMLLGMQFGLVAYISARHEWFPTSAGLPMPGFDRVLPLVVIVLVLSLRGKNLPTRGAISAGRLPASPTPPDWAVRYAGPALAVATAILALFVFTPDFRLALSTTLIGVIICLSSVVITGYVGQISLAQMAFAGISAFIVSKLTSQYNVPFPIPIFIGAAVAAVVGLIVAIPALRVRGVNLAIVTLAFAVAVDKAVFGNQAFNGGMFGAKVDTPQMFTESRNVRYRIFGLLAGDGKQPNPMTAVFVLVVVVILCYLVANLRRSATGRKLLATRSNERAAAAAGINVSGMKMLAFGTSSFIAGVGGAVFAYRTGAVAADRFDYLDSLTFFAFAYLGGIACVSGAISGGMLVSGGLFFTFLHQVFHIPEEFTLILGGLGLIVAAVRNPEGIAGAVGDLGRLVSGAWRRKQPPPVVEEAVA
ncbi:MAG TPA: ABC transporter permease [Ilumatobacter sp.]|nr:ABC transporter permease [Ilumatobacter sp.]